MRSPGGIGRTESNEGLLGRFSIDTKASKHYIEHLLVSPSAKTKLESLFGPDLASTDLQGIYDVPGPPKRRRNMQKLREVGFELLRLLATVLSGGSGWFGSPHALSDCGTTS